MNRTSKRWLIVSGLGISLIAVMIAWNSHIRAQDEALAKRLIAEFHERYNSNESDETSEYGPIIEERIEEARGRLGRLSSVKHCAVRRFAEPPWLEAKCLSSFQNGEAQELFIMHHAPDDQHLTIYSAKSDGKEFSDR